MSCIVIFVERLDEETKNVRVRKYGEVLASAVSSVAAALEYPKELIKDSVRPEYWAKDSDSPSCALCEQFFGNNIDDMEQSKIRELSNASGSSGLQNSPMHAILDVRRHHVILFNVIPLIDFIYYLEFIVCFSVVAVVLLFAINVRSIEKVSLNTWLHKIS